jgi:uncharacterized membrane protein
MAEPAFLFAVLVGISAATYTTFLKLGSGAIHPALGAVIVTSAAAVVNGLVLLVAVTRGQGIAVTPRAAGLMVVVGVAAAGVDLFGLLAYSRGLKLSSSLISGGVYTSLILVVGFGLLGEPLTAMRLLALGLIAAGILLLHAQGV